MREHGPTMILAAALLAFFGIRIAAPDRPAAPGEARADKRARTADEPADRGDHFWWPLEAFRRTGAGPAGEDKDEADFEGVAVWRGFPDVAGWELETLLASVPDPVDSTSAYQFDSVIDAIQRGVETQNYVLDRYYYPWSGQKGKGDKPAPLDLTVRGSLTAGEGRLTVKEGDKGAAGRPFEREPGALLFRAAPGVRPGPDASPEAAARPHLLLVLLVGETATAGTHKEAFTAGLRLVGRSRQYRQTARVRFLGPFFSGAQTSLASAISRWADVQVCTAWAGARAGLAAVEGRLANLADAAAGLSWGAVGHFLARRLLLMACSCWRSW